MCLLKLSCVKTVHISAMISILFIIFWSRYLYDIPENHPNISKDEYYYLLENVGISDEVYNIILPLNLGYLF